MCTIYASSFSYILHNKMLIPRRSMSSGSAFYSTLAWNSAWTFDPLDHPGYQVLLSIALAGCNTSNAAMGFKSPRPVHLA